MTRRAPRDAKSGLPAVGFVPFGSPVQAEGAGCAVAADLGRMIGVARRTAAIWADVHGYQDGELVDIERDGGVRAQLAADAEVIVHGVATRLLASDPHYLHLQAGKVIGFQGDRQLAGGGAS